MFRGPLESGAPPPWVGKMMKTSKDVGLVVVGADLVGLVDAHTHLGSWRSAPTAVRGREPPPLLPRSLVQTQLSSSSNTLV